MGYTDEEVRSTVEKLLLASIRRPVNSLGSRDVDITFNDIQQAAAGVYMLYPRAPFYTVQLSAQRLLGELRAAQGAIEQLLITVDVLRRRVLPVRDVSSLVNAKVALFELESAVGRETTTDVTKVPAYGRFSQNVTRFLQQASAIKKDGMIVPTPQEARKKLPDLLRVYQEAVAAIKKDAALLHASLEDFAAVGLPKLVASSVVAKARRLVASRSDELETLGETERLEVLREAVLDLLGAKAAVTKFGSAPSLGSVIALSGEARGFADSTRPAEPAALLAEKPGPYVTLPEDGTYRLQVWLDGAAPPVPPATYPPPDEVFFFPVSFYARLEGQVTEPFAIASGRNDQLAVRVAGVDVTATLTPGAARSAEQVCSDLNAALSATAFVAEPYYAPLKFDGTVSATAADTIEVIGSSFPIDPSTGQSYLAVGDLVTFYAGPNTGTRSIVAVLPSAADPRQLVLSGPALSLGAGQRVQAGGAARRIRLVPQDRRQACLGKLAVQLRTGTDRTANGAMTLGFYGELVSRSRPTDASVLARYVNEHSTRMQARTYLVPVLTNVQVRTDAAHAQRLVVFYVRGMASCAGGGPGHVEVTLGDAVEDLMPLAGATIVFRSGYDAGAAGTVVIAYEHPDGTTRLAVDFGQAVSAGSVLVEVGPSASVQPDMVVEVASGPNAGRYYVDEITAVPFEFTVRDVLPKYRDSYAQPEFMRAAIGWEHLVLVSKSQAQQSKVSVRDDALLLFSSPGPHEQEGKTAYLKLPSLPKELEEGSVVEYFEQLGAATFTAQIAAKYADAVVKLDAQVACSFVSGFGPHRPYLRIRKNKVVHFEVFQQRLGQWLSRPDVRGFDRYLLDLNRLINPLLQNENPQGTDVVAAINRVRDLYSLLLRSAADAAGVDQDATLEAVLESYDVEPVGEVDALLRSFRERGADRALAALLRCQFTMFFGMDREDVSYAGSLQKAMRAVAREDLPVRKVDRRDVRVSPVIASSRSTDYEYSADDLDPAGAPDVPDI